MVKSVFGDNPSKKIETDLDPCTGTGRFLLIATIDYPMKPLILFGIEIDLTLYRACLVNMALFSNHPYSILCGDTLMMIKEPWELGNLWNPPDMSPYYCGYGREIPHGHGISFEELMKRKAERLQAEKDLNITSEPIIAQQQTKRAGFSLEKYVASRNKK